MSETNNNFTELKRLLKLKQHEVPPPGYFNHFSGEVISRIRAGEPGESQTFAEQMRAQAPWLAVFLRIFETKPGMIGAFATSLCLVLLVGVVLAERPDSVPTDVLANSAPAPEAAAPLMAAVAPADPSGIAISPSPVVSLQPTPALFGQQNPLFQSASFTPGVR
jgi:hypothetical protein